MHGTLCKVHMCPPVYQLTPNTFHRRRYALIVFCLNSRPLWSNKSYRNIRLCLSFFAFTSREMCLEFAYFNNFHYYTIVEIYWAEDQFGILILRHTWPLHVYNIRSIVHFLFIIGLNSTPNQNRWGYAQYSNTSSNNSAGCG
jgi:hypothetical protein